MNVRRLAAIDMYGTRGTIRRRRIILAEFLIGVVAMVAFGIWLVTSASDVSVRVLAAWMVGAGLNYAPLAAYAVALSRPGALDADLARRGHPRRVAPVRHSPTVDPVPLSLVVLAARETFTSPRER